MEGFVNFVMGETQYLTPEGLVRIVGLAIVIEFIAIIGRAFRF